MTVTFVFWVVIELSVDTKKLVGGGAAPSWAGKGSSLALAFIAAKMWRNGGPHCKDDDDCPESPSSEQAVALLVAGAAEAQGEVVPSSSTTAATYFAAPGLSRKS
ncbi:hypothetical protein FOA52_000378 [Chlamydomonas sp. UWO 241]|nr:hypothetical protein FOA52_000378 [Chlamydomonas sp. UWO 241]